MSKKTLYKVFPRQATWLELFFDLVFVAVIGVLTQYASWAYCSRAILKISYDIYSGLVDMGKSYTLFKSI